MISSVVSGLATLRGMGSSLTWLGWAIAGAGAVAAAAVIWIGAHDARVADRATTTATVKCEADRLAQSLAAERAKAEALRRAGIEKDAELRRRQDDAARAATDVANLEQERGKLRAKVRSLEGARTIALPDDDWLRGRARPGAADAAGR